MINYHDGTLMDLDAQHILDNQEPFRFNVEDVLSLRFSLTKKREDILSRFPEGYTNSSNDIIKLLKTKYNWKPEVYTKNGNPSTKGDHLAMFNEDIVDDILELKEIDKILSYIKGWLKYENNGTISHTCTSIGSATHRVAHSNPNLGAIPSHGSYGKRCRSSFSVAQGTYQVGVDLSAIELRVLAHYLYNVDNGKYAEVIQSGDIHTYNAQAIGSTRDVAKVFVYAWLYGAGAETLRGMLGYISRKEIFDMTNGFDTNIEGLHRLGLAVRNKADKYGYIRAIDGRKIMVDANYKAMNYLLQSTAAVIAKTWMVIAHKRLTQKYGNKFKQLAFVHDEIQYQVDSSIDSTEFIAIVQQAAIDAGKQLEFKVPVESEAKVGNSWAETH